MSNPDWYVSAAEVEEQRKHGTLRRIATRRWEVEAAGVEYQGIRFPGTDVGRQHVAEVLAAAREYEADTGDTWTTDWKGADGNWLVGVGVDDLKAVMMLGAQRRQACFAREKELADAVADGTFTESMLDEGWPRGD